MKTEEANERLAQEAWDHISKTRKKSIGENGYCAYGGIGCAFSPALDSDESREFLDQQVVTVSEIILSNGLSQRLKPWARCADPDFARHVQRAHDGALEEEGDQFVNDFAGDLSKACHEFNVKLPDGLEVKALDYP